MAIKLMKPQLAVAGLLIVVFALLAMQFVTQRSEIQ